MIAHAIIDIVRQLSLCTSEIGKPMVEQTGVLSAYDHVFRLSRRGLRQELLQFLERMAHVLGVPFRRLLHPGIGQALLKAA